LIQTLLAIFASDILPVFLIAGAGFLLARYSDVSVRALARVIFNVLSPCLVFTLMVTSTISLTDFGRMALFCVLVTAACGAAAAVAGRALRLDRTALVAFILAVMFSNSGNYGLPVIMFAFGRDALAFATVYFVTSSILMYTLGVFLAASGRRSVRESIVGVARVPAVYGVLAAAIVLMFGLTVPVPIMRPVQLLTDASLPMMILVLGMQLQRATRPDRLAPIVAAVALCLFVTPAIAIALAYALPLTGAAFQAGIIQASMPAAIVTTIIALEYDVAPSFVTNVVFASTLLSPLTLTALIAWLQRL
jgi:predicted permease